MYVCVCERANERERWREIYMIEPGRGDRREMRCDEMGKHRDIGDNKSSEKYEREICERKDIL